MSESFGELLRRAREATEDPLTGGPYTQMRLGELVCMSDAIVSRWETGKGYPSMSSLNELCSILPTLGMGDALRALGYQLPDTAGLQPDERELLAEYRALPEPEHRVQARRLLRALSPTPTGRPRPRSRRRS